MDKHVREVRANPDAFCQYTQEFAKLYASRLKEKLQTRIF